MIIWQASWPLSHHHHHHHRQMSRWSPDKHRDPSLPPRRSWRLAGWRSSPSRCWSSAHTRYHSRSELSPREFSVEWARLKQDCEIKWMYKLNRENLDNLIAWELFDFVALVSGRHIISYKRFKTRLFSISFPDGSGAPGACLTRSADLTSDQWPGSDLWDGGIASIFKTF